MPDTPARPTLLQRVALWIIGALIFYVVALYPNFLMAGFQPDDVVHYGFLKWLAVALVLYWTALQLFFTERPADPRPGRQTLAVTAAILVIIGAFAPIVSFPFVGEVDFFRAGYGDGYILLVMAVLSAALAVTRRWKQVLIPGLGSLAVIVWSFLSVQDTVSQARSGAGAELAGNPHEGLAPSVMQSIQWEWGWLPLFAGGCLLVYAAARKDQSEPEYPPLESVAAEADPEPVEEAPAAETSGSAAEATAEETAAEAATESAAAAPEPATETPAEDTEAEPAGTEESGSAAPTAETASVPAAATTETAAEAPARDPEAAPAEPIAEEPQPAATAGGAEATHEAARTTADAAAAEPAAREPEAESATPAAATLETAGEASSPEPEAAAAQPAAATVDAEAATATASAETGAAGTPEAASTSAAGVPEAAAAEPETAEEEAAPAATAEPAQADTSELGNTGGTDNPAEAPSKPASETK